MKILKISILISIATLVFWACASSPKKNKITKQEEPVVIANDSLEYEIIIIDPGFNYFLNAIAQPEGFYSQQYLENRNRVWVISWNFRAQSINQFDANIYQNVIDYEPSINYGYEVNYKLFNYFLFAQRKYNMTLGGGFRTNRIN
ncbi:hypothetical protein DUT90_11690 [Polaribacter sp. WD7]|uniref:DUF6146 family protein n=1 Tax=Polaribacter sp. WD7 TaxID=2269061 RepID=UPI000DF13E24|nr:DUF6146 family protein [Polaribacter sp. WD7]RCS26416.1 hypothetical protein DUT90_11690 [Polaribacter sp. WD7]